VNFSCSIRIKTPLLNALSYPKWKFQYQKQGVEVLNHIEEVMEAIVDEENLMRKRVWMNFMSKFDHAKKGEVSYVNSKGKPRMRGERLK